MQAGILRITVRHISFEGLAADATLLCSLVKANYLLELFTSLPQ